MKYFLLISCFCLILFAPCFGQQTELGQAKVQYKYMSSFSPLIHSHGVGLNYRRGKHLTGFSQRYFEFELVNMKHPKETKVQNQYFDNTKGYIYGKLNSVFMFRPGIGIRKVLYSKENKGAVEISYQLFGGPSLAFAKPVYLEILPPTAFVNGRPDLDTERYDPEKHFVDNIYGKAPFMRGLAGTTVNPGAYGKISLNVEHSPEDDMIRAIEAGLIVDAYAKKVLIMATEQNTPVFLTLYLSFQYGRKWY